MTAFVRHRYRRSLRKGIVQRGEQNPPPPLRILAGKWACNYLGTPGTGKKNTPPWHPIDFLFSKPDVGLSSDFLQYESSPRSTVLRTT